jgi:hypothetical protein
MYKYMWSEWWNSGSYKSRCNVWRLHWVENGLLWDFQSRSERGGEDKNLPVPRNEPMSSSPYPSNYTEILRLKALVCAWVRSLS